MKNRKVILFFVSLAVLSTGFLLSGKLNISPEAISEFSKAIILLYGTFAIGNVGEHATAGMKK